ncbi:MAG TPA: phosphoribosyltransferase family protein [Micromonosporaceae bacterium]|nr:phosphoribosyltransferase family protein [Micromonosporaceae bacterium]
MTFADRRDAGQVVAAELAGYAGRADVIVLGLVRGGVPVAAEIARRLDVPLDVLVVRKLGVPWSPEVAFGAVGPHGVRVVNADVAGKLTPAEIAAVMRHESAELVRRERRYRSGKPELDLSDRVAILVDDGLATGATARAAVAVARRLGAAEVVLAAPVGSAGALAALRRLADAVVCPLEPADFRAVSTYYADFAEVRDAEVIALLRAQG